MRKLTILLLIILSGCVTPVVQQYDTLEKEEIYCTSVKEIPKTLIEPNNELRVAFKKGSPVYDFGTGKSYTAILELPPDNNYHFIARSFFNGLEIGQFFQPIFISLNENYQATEIFTLDMQFVEAGWIRSAHMGAAFKLPTPTKYLVIFTSQLDKEAPIANIEPSMSATLIGDIPIVSVNPGYGIALTRTPTGVMKFELKMDDSLKTSQ